MATQTNCTPEEWETLRNAPYLATAAVMIAGRSGLLSSLQEALIIAQRFAESSASEKALLKALSAPDELRAGQACVRGQVSLREAAEAPENLRHLAVEQCHAAVTLLQQKGEAGEADAYKRWVMDMARQKAASLHEG